MLPVKSRDKLGASGKRIESMGQPTRGKGSRKRSSHSYPDTPRPSKLLDVDKSQSKMPSTPLVQNVATEILAPHLSTKLSSCNGGYMDFSRTSIRTSKENLSLVKERNSTIKPIVIHRSDDSPLPRFYELFHSEALIDFNDTVNPKKDIILCYLGDADLDEKTGYLQNLESFLSNSAMTNIFVIPRDDNKREEAKQICVKYKLCPPTNVITMDSGKDLLYDTLLAYGQTTK